MATIPPVREDEEYLNRLVQQYHNTLHERKLRMLLFMKTDSSMPLDNIAAQLDRSPRTIQRWQRIYRTQGLEALIGKAQEGSSHQITKEESQALCNALANEELSTLEDIQHWLQREYGKTFSKRGISGILSRIDARRIWTVNKEVPDSRNQNQEEANRLQNQLTRFLYQLPVEIPVGDWCRQTRDILQEAFPDVDRVTISVNTSCDLLHPKEYKPRFAISQDAYPDHEHKGLHIIRHTSGEETSIASNLLREFQRQGYPIEDYHPPSVMTLHYRGAYLGTIFFWRDRLQSAISKDTLRVISLMEKFLVYALSDAIMRHHYTTPVERVFYSTLREVASQARLTPQEYRVMTYRLLGYMYKEIASELNVTQDNVKKTLQQVYRKTETRSHIEFFAKYFTPRIIPSQLPEKQEEH